ncbi:hypothetical protein CFK37_00220 [Virgibacillus phasianinus]|uniref:DUF421 domain-containing protein n=1 Tax=Virgibacillus phasianinus TaxID=2017483 RepID=A0A220TY50_9BACI|nr:DUF421 domain-containing protein [Virgibacillus phasianinus]ASK60742.1 hypothetical protein CFK37_00220 [Virgibacillus phasianinus]
MENLLPIFLDSVFGFIALFLLVKVLGKTQITQLTPFDFIAALILGELVAGALFDKDIGIVEIGFSLFLWGTMLFITETITQKYKGTRGLLEGQPSIIIRHGQLIREEMKKNNLDINQLQHMLRAKDAFSIQEVAYAILETNGTVSVMKKSTYQQPTRGDLNLVPEAARLSLTLVNDGEVIWDNLKEANHTEEWLEDELKKQEVNSVKDVFYAEWTDGKDLFVLPFVRRS